MIRNQYANDIRRYTQSQYAIRMFTQFTQYHNSIRINTHIYANDIYAQIRRIYAKDLRSQYAWYAINTQSICNQYTVIRNCNTQINTHTHACIRNSYTQFTIRNCPKCQYAWYANTFFHTHQYASIRSGQFADVTLCRCQWLFACDSSRYA